MLITLDQKIEDSDLPPAPMAGAAMSSSSGTRRAPTCRCPSGGIGRRSGLAPPAARPARASEAM